MNKNFVIRCFHTEECGDMIKNMKELGVATDCLKHCDKSWNSRTLEQAECIKTVHITNNVGHEVEVKELE